MLNGSAIAARQIFLKRSSRLSTPRWRCRQIRKGMPHEPQLHHRTCAWCRPFDREVDRRDDCCPDSVGPHLQPACPICGMGCRVDASRPEEPLRRGDQLLRLRYAEGADAAHPGCVRHGRRAQLLFAGEDPGATRRKARRRRQCAGRIARHRYSILLLLRRAAVHRLRQRGRAARRNFFVPDLRADGERGGARTSLWTCRLENCAHLSRLWSCRRYRLRLDHRPVPSRTLAGGMGS